MLKDDYYRFNCVHKCTFPLVDVFCSVWMYTGTNHRLSRDYDIRFCYCAQNICFHIGVKGWSQIVSSQMLTSGMSRHTRGAYLVLMTWIWKEAGSFGNQLLFHQRTTGHFCHLFLTTLSPVISLLTHLLRHPQNRQLQRIAFAPNAVWCCFLLLCGAFLCFSSFVGKYCLTLSFPLANSANDKEPF